MCVMSLQHVSGPLPAPQDHGATKARKVGWSCRKTCNVSCVLQDAILTHLLGWMCLVGACPVGSWGHQTQHPAAVLCAVASHPGQISMSKHRALQGQAACLQHLGVCKAKPHGCTGLMHFTSVEKQPLMAAGPPCMAA